MRKIGIKAKACAVVLALAITAAPFTYAYNVANAMVQKPVAAPVKSGYQDTIDKAKETKKEYEKKAQEAKSQLDTVSKEYNSILSYIHELDDKSNKLYAQLATIESTIDYLNTEKEATLKIIADTKVLRDAQYKTMSARIKYVYENGETSYFDILFGSKSITDILNRVEYISKIAEYDDKIFNEFASTVQQMTEYNDMLDIQLETIAEVQKAYDYYLEYAQELADAKEEALEECAKNLGTSKEVYETYIQQIESQNMTIKEAEAAMKAEAEAAERAEAERKKQLELQQQQQQQGGQQSQDPPQQTIVPPPANVTGTGASSVAGITLSDESGVNKMIWPLPGYSEVSSKFGPRVSPTAGASSNHKGIDIPCKYGTPIVAASAGTVVSSTYGTGEGNYVMIQHADGNFTIYMHASERLVNVGEHVQRGQVIAKAGATGVATGIHLHFGVIVSGQYVNPLSYVAY